MKKYWAVLLILVTMLCVGCETTYTPPKSKFKPLTEIHVGLNAQRVTGKTNFKVTISGDNGHQQVKESVSVYGGIRIRNVPVPGLYHIRVTDKDNGRLVGYAQIYVIHQQKPVMVDISVDN